MQPVQKTSLAHLLMQGVKLPHLDTNELIGVYLVDGQTFVEPFMPGEEIPNNEDLNLVLICHDSEVLGLLGVPAECLLLPF